MWEISWDSQRDGRCAAKVGEGREFATYLVIRLVVGAAGTDSFQNDILVDDFVVEGVKLLVDRSPVFRLHLGSKLGQNWNFSCLWPIVRTIDRVEPPHFRLRQDRRV